MLLQQLTERGIWSPSFSNSRPGHHQRTLAHMLVWQPQQVTKRQSITYAQLPLAPLHASLSHASLCYVLYAGSSRHGA